MENISEKDIAWLTQSKEEFDYTSISREEKKTTSSKNTSLKSKLIKISLWILLIAALSIIPFFVLIKTSLFLTVEQGLNPWVALVGGIGTCMLLLLVYVILTFRKVENKKLMLKFGFGGVGILVGGFCLYGLLYLSSVNAKTESVREVYRSLHPVLRVSVATLTLADNDLVITDIKRTAEDYASMGLPVNQSSLHFAQEDGFVHAIDLRTKGHSEFRNFMIRNSFRLLGFKTIRHVGTADHLHISMPDS